MGRWEGSAEGSGVGFADGPALGSGDGGGVGGDDGAHVYPAVAARTSQHGVPRNVSVVLECQKVVSSIIPLTEVGMSPQRLSCFVRGSGSIVHPGAMHTVRC